MKNKKDNSIAIVLEDVTFMLNEIKQIKLKELEKTKLTSKQEKILEDVEKDLDTCVTKIGLMLHAKEL